MYKIATTLLCLHLVFALYGQNYSVKTFKKSGFQCSSMGISVYSNSDIRNNNADPIILKNNYILKDYNSCSLTIQNVTPNVYNILKILVGYKGEDMVMVFDNNHNLTFKDDSVYTHRIKKDSFSDKDLRNQLPEIKIDSLEYVDSNGIRLYFSRLIKFCPTLKISEATRGYNSMLKSSKIKLIVFSDSAFISEKFKIGMDDYHIEIVPHPFIFSVYPIMRSRFAASFSLVRNYPNDSTSVAGFGLLEDIIQNRKPIYFEKKQIRIGSFDSCADSLFFSISDKSATADSINSSLSIYTHLLLRDLKKHNISVRNKKFTVLEFGGSWCKPCNEIVPQIREFNAGNKDSIAFISILKERDLSIALKYVKVLMPEWETYFEKLECTDDSCLGTLFEVGIYPTVVLINSSGDILFKASGSDCIQKLKRSLKI